MPNLRKILEEAASEIRAQGHPSGREAQSRLNGVLAAAGFEFTRTAQVTKLAIDAERVTVELTYAVRGCVCDDTFEFPTSIIDAADPLQAATRWGLERKRAETVEEIRLARLALTEAEATLVELDARLAAA